MDRCDLVLLLGVVAKGDGRQHDDAGTAAGRDAGSLLGAESMQEALRQAAKLRGTVFIHIGTHKTGTTSVQHFLAENAAELRRERILIPSAGTYLHGHHHIAWELRNDDRLNGRTGHVQRLFDELRETDLDTAVVSSEDFEYLSQCPEILEAFAAALRTIGFEPVFVVFFRERRAYLASLAAALANHGVRHPMEWYSGQLDAHDAILVKRDWFFDFNRERFESRWTEITEAEIVALDYDACTNGAEVDFVLGPGEVAIEVKGTSRVDDRDLRSLALFRETHRPRLAVVVSHEPEERVVAGVRILPWRLFFEELWNGRIMGG